LIYLALSQGRLEEAERLAQECTAAAEDLGDLESVHWGHRLLNQVRYYRGEFACARENWEKIAALYEELGLQIRLVEATQSLSRCDLHLGMYDRSYALAQKTLARCEEAGYAFYAGLTRELLGQVELALGRAAEARQQSLRTLKEGGSRAGTLARLGMADRALSHRPDAVQHVRQALRVAVDGTFWIGLMYTLPVAALLLADAGRKELAVEIYSLAARYPYVDNSRWFEDLAGGHIAAAAASLPPETRKAARERGRARDLWATAEELLLELGG
jgi:tetratricopeptide (TPR) repeat protein